MGYFEDMQVQEKLYTPNVTYNYDAFTFWSNDYTQKKMDMMNKNITFQLIGLSFLNTPL